MKFSHFFAAIFLVIAMFATGSRVTARDIKDYVGQQPLLFGRRGLNPNMNSLFFGKRGVIDSGVSLRELKNACAMLMTYGA
uniref:Ffamide 2 n=1 Tax=Deroceras reticulatum TaxID=145610 RepID=A0A1X9WEE2_DERRE|nr:ffamide 2 [Deroceras reticulatum]